MSADDEMVTFFILKLEFDDLWTPVFVKPIILLHVNILYLKDSKAIVLMKVLTIFMNSVHRFNTKCK